MTPEIWPTRLESMKTKRTSSKRSDRRGHWPKGKWRNGTDPQRAAQVLAQVAELIRVHGAPGRISARALAAQLRVTDRSVRRWLAGTSLPAPDSLRAIEKWIVKCRSN